MKHRMKLTVIRSECRGGLHSEGEEYVIGEVCPPICHELWNNIYPMLYAAGCGADIESGEGYSSAFTASCPDGGRVTVKCERIDD